MPSAIAIRVRDLRAEDMDALAKLWAESWASAGLPTEADGTPGALRVRLARESQAAWRVRVASVDTSIAGFIAWEVEPAWVRQLFVAPAWQGKGVGARLLAEARASLPGGFWLRTAASNRGARRFYEREGLKVAAEAPHPDHGRLTTTYVWRPDSA